MKLNINNKNKLIKIFKKYKPIGYLILQQKLTLIDQLIHLINLYNSNILGTFNLLEAFKKYSKKNKKSKLIHISTDEVYGDIIKGRTKENYPYSPSSPYAASKASSDHIVFSYIKTFGIKAIITNCSNNYGPKTTSRKTNSKNNL